MTKEFKQAIKYAKKSGCTDFYSRNAHYTVKGENLIRKELYFGAIETTHKIN